MISDGQRLGAALMEMNTPTARTQITFKGEAFGNTAREIAEKAGARAYEFFGDGIAYALDIDVSVSPLLRATNDAPKFRGVFYARSV